MMKFSELARDSKIRILYTRMRHMCRKDTEANGAVLNVKSAQNGRIGIQSVQMALSARLFDAYVRDSRLGDGGN